MVGRKESYVEQDSVGAESVLRERIFCSALWGWTEKDVV